MNFKPNKKKVVISLVITLVWWVFLYIISNSLICGCLPGGFESCVDYYYLSPIRGGCHCGCYSIGMVIYHYLYALVLPFVLSYIFLSLIEKRGKKK